MSPTDDEFLESADELDADAADLEAIVRRRQTVQAKVDALLEEIEELAGAAVDGAAAGIRASGPILIGLAVGALQDGLERRRGR